MMSFSRIGFSPGMSFLHSVYRTATDFLLYHRVHFIPLSSSYSEIYNIYAYSSGATQSTLDAANSTAAALPPDHELRRNIEGDKRARRIARAGKRWKGTVGRTLDMEGGFA